MANQDDDRTVEFTDDDSILPEQTTDDTDAGWGEAPRRKKRALSARDREILEERPPHW